MKLKCLPDLKQELKRIQQAQADCLDKSGMYVLPQYRYRYQMLIRKAHEFNEAIKWIEENFSDKEILIDEK